jgi:hypothetical protein
VQKPVRINKKNTRIPAGAGMALPDQKKNLPRSGLFCGITNDRIGEAALKQPGKLRKGVKSWLQYNCSNFNPHV